MYVYLRATWIISPYIPRHSSAASAFCFLLNLSFNMNEWWAKLINKTNKNKGPFLNVLCTQWSWEAATAGHKRSKSIINNFMLQLLVLSRQILLLSRGKERMCFCFKIKARLFREPVIGACSIKQASPVIYPVLSLIATDLRLTGKQIKHFIVIKVWKHHKKKKYTERLLVYESNFCSANCDDTIHNHKLCLEVNFYNQY